MTNAYLILVLVTIQRLIELGFSARNTKQLFKRGGKEFGRSHYFLFIVIHTSWLISIAVFIEPGQTINGIWLILFLLLQLGRVWVIVALGTFWTTRIITIQSEPLVSTGPYKFCRHPNYLVVFCEIIVLPLVFGAWQLAIGFGFVNALLLAHRIKLEDNVLKSRC